MLLFKPANAIRWFITVWKLWAILPRKMHHPLKLYKKNFFRVTFIKPNSTWNWQTQSCPVNQYLLACTSKKAWKIFHPLVSKGDFMYHVSPCVGFTCPPAPSGRSHTGGRYLNGVHRSLSRGGTRCMPSYLMRKDEKGTLGDKRLWKILFWEFLYRCLCGLRI